MLCTVNGRVGVIFWIPRLGYFRFLSLTGTRMLVEPDQFPPTAAKGDVWDLGGAR